MTEEKYYNAVNEYLYLVNDMRYLMGHPFSKEVFEVREAKVVPELSPELPPKQKENSLEKLIQGNESRQSDDTITPTILKKEFLTCSRCPLSSVSRVLGEGVQLHPQVFVITDTLLGDSEREYLDTILKTIHLNPETNTYITSLVKCTTNKAPSPECYTACSRFLKMQFALYSPLAAIGFGVEASNFLRQIKNMDDYKHCAFIFTRMPFDLKNNIDAKRKVWESFKKLVVFLNLPRI